MEEKLYEITVYTENQVGLLNAIAGMFMRRSLNIELLTVLPSQIPNVHKFTIQTRTTEDKVKQMVLQMERKVDVIKAFWYVDNENATREIESVGNFLTERENNNK